MANSKKRCSGCRKYFPSTEMKVFGTTSFCSLDCAVTKASTKSNIDKGHKIKRKIHKQKKDLVKPLKWYLDRAQVAFNKFIRLRDKGLPCVSCGKPDNGLHQRHASHYKSRGANSYLRFDEDNVHASCSTCNNYLSGNIEGYITELPKRIGYTRFNKLQESPRLKSWTKEEAVAIYKKYTKKCKELESDR